MTDEGTGYAQKNFTIGCSNSKCKHVINKEKLGIHKLIRDLVRGSEQPDFVLAGTLWKSTDAEDVAHGRHVKRAFMNNAAFRSDMLMGPAYEDKLMKVTNGSAEYMRKSAAKHMKHGGGDL